MIEILDCQGRRKSTAELTGDRRTPTPYYSAGVTIASRAAQSNSITADAEASMPKTPTSSPASPEDVALAIRDFDASLDLLDQAAAAAFGIGRTDLRAMEIVSRSGPRTAGEIAAELNLTTGAVTALIDRMEKADYLRRSRNTSDRRQVVIELTPNAKRREQRVFGPLGKESAAMLRRLSGAERAVIADFLRAVREMTERARKGIEAGA